MKKYINIEELAHLLRFSQDSIHKYWETFVSKGNVHFYRTKEGKLRFNQQDIHQAMENVFRVR